MIPAQQDCASKSQEKRAGCADSLEKGIKKSHHFEYGEGFS
jgi:hypothetical protein